MHRERTPHGTTRVHGHTLLRAAGELARHAIEVFALESNRRLRRARISVVRGDDEIVRVIWDAVAPSEPALGACLPPLVDAVSGARSETQRALSALSCDAVAQAYLNQRTRAW